MMKVMTLVEMLNNPQRKAGGELDGPFNERVMARGAARIDHLETAINRYLADDFHCNGGAIELFETAMADDV